MVGDDACNEIGKNNEEPGPGIGQVVVIRHHEQQGGGQEVSDQLKQDRDRYGRQKEHPEVLFYERSIEGFGISFD